MITRSPGRRWTCSTRSTASNAPAARPIAVGGDGRRRRTTPRRSRAAWGRRTPKPLRRSLGVDVDPEAWPPRAAAAGRGRVGDREVADVRPELPGRAPGWGVPPTAAARHAGAAPALGDDQSPLAEDPVRGVDGGRASTERRGERANRRQRLSGLERAVADRRLGARGYVARGPADDRLILFYIRNEFVL